MKKWKTDDLDWILPILMFIFGLFLIIGSILKEGL